ncbi:hypothetical protein CROQUDRAFT_92579 [Cronartium quercuum f. sp. fusiforme G11]|uniref:Uncharacterized protein n=1 Tax=Cronartium quercuum f. sp. fusiforme G11 TaxID=708437 RepID=A0A9P6TCE6_9BASI|nr:hypothetical protein CROQUDRAFT_92579 [Cronartium quercuum f. sp. fusiforme G11]
MLLPSSLLSSPGLLALLTLTVGSRELLIIHAHQAEDLLHWALYSQYLIPPPMHDRVIHIPTWDPPSCRLVNRFYPHELTSTQKRVEADENFKEKQEKTGQAQPGAHVTKLRSHGTLISQLLPGHAEPKPGAIPSLYHARYQSYNAARILFEMTIRAALFLTPFAVSNPTLGRYWRPKLNITNSFLQPYGQVCTLSLMSSASKN